MSAQVILEVLQQPKLLATNVATKLLLLVGLFHVGDQFGIEVIPFAAVGARVLPQIPLRYQMDVQRILAYVRSLTIWTSVRLYPCVHTHMQQQRTLAQQFLTAQIARVLFHFVGSGPRPTAPSLRRRFPVYFQLVHAVHVIPELIVVARNHAAQFAFHFRGPMLLVTFLGGELPPTQLAGVHRRHAGVPGCGRSFAVFG